MTWTLEAKLATLTFKDDPNPHIEVTDTAACLECEGRPCTIICPAKLYE